jgi:transposase
VAQTITELLGITIATSTYQWWRKRAAVDLDKFETRLRACLLAEPVLGADETTIRISGRKTDTKQKTQYLHAVVSEKHTLFHVGDRSIGAIKAGGVLGSYGGIIESDCYVAYWSFGSDHQRCNAHLLRDLQKVIDDFAGATDDPGAWAAQVQELVNTTKAKVDKRPDGILTSRQYATAKQAMVALGRLGLESHPPGPKRTSKTTSNARALATRLVEHADEYFLYAINPDVHFTNNLAEQAVRPAKVKQRRSGCFRSLSSAKEHALLRSYLETGRKHGHAPEWLLSKLVQGKPWMPRVPNSTE